MRRGYLSAETFVSRISAKWSGDRSPGHQQVDSAGAEWLEMHDERPAGMAERSS